MLPILNALFNALMFGATLFYVLLAYVIIALSLIGLIGYFTKGRKLISMGNDIPSILEKWGSDES